MFVNQLHEKAHETLKSGNIEQAIELYTQVLKEHPTNCDVLSDRGVAYLHANDKQKCMADLDRAVELQPDYAYRYACRAFAKSRFEDIDGAVKDYEKAVELDPDDAVAHNNLGMLLEQKGYKKEAQERFERADKLAKAEKNLYDVMDDLETTGDIQEKKEEDTSQETPPKQTEELGEADNEETSGTQEFKKIFTSRQQFKEFIAFVKNGFKQK